MLEVLRDGLRLIESLAEKWLLANARRGTRRPKRGAGKEFLLRLGSPSVSTGALETGSRGPLA